LVFLRTVFPDCISAVSFIHPPIVVLVSCLTPTMMYMLCLHVSPLSVFFCIKLGFFWVLDHTRAYDYYTAIPIRLCSVINPLGTVCDGFRTPGRANDGRWPRNGSGYKTCIYDPEVHNSLHSKSPNLMVGSRKAALSLSLRCGSRTRSSVWGIC